MPRPPLFVFATLTACLLGFSGVASAQSHSGGRAPESPRVPLEPHSPVRDTKQTGRVWYGWQTLAADAASVGVVALAAATADGDAALAVGLGSYVLGAPIVHAANGRIGAAMGSASLRLALPVIAFSVSMSSGDCDGVDDGREPSSCGPERAVGPVLGALATATLVDALLLSWKAPPAKEPERAHHVSVRPSIALTRESRSLVLAGTF
jgi:hypothetical protein